MHRRNKIHIWTITPKMTFKYFVFQPAITHPLQKEIYSVPKK